jgi:hypothetical protein
MHQNHKNVFKIFLRKKEKNSIDIFVEEINILSSAYFLKGDFKIFFVGCEFLTIFFLPAVVEGDSNPRSQDYYQMFYHCAQQK